MIPVAGDPGDTAVTQHNFRPDQHPRRVSTKLVMQKDSQCRSPSMPSTAACTACAYLDTHTQTSTCEAAWDLNQLLLQHAHTPSFTSENHQSSELALPNSSLLGNTKHACVITVLASQSASAVLTKPLHLLMNQANLSDTTSTEPYRTTHLLQRQSNYLAVTIGTHKPEPFQSDTFNQSN